MDEEEETL